MSESKTILTAAAVGAVAGLVAGLLIAPDKGSVTRKRIADSSKKVADNVMDYANAGVSTVNNLKKKFVRKTDGIHADVETEDTVW